MPTYYDANGNIVSDPSAAVVMIDANGNAVDLTGGAGSAAISAGSTSSGFSMSGFGNALAGIGTAFANAYQAVTGPSVNVVNPRTGQPYTQAQLTALAQQNAQLGAAGSLSGLLPIAVIVLVAVLLLRR